VAVVFSYLHLMYDFDSHFVHEYEDEEERSREVRKAIHRGSEFKMTRTVTAAKDKYKELYDKEAVSLYSVLRNNVFKMKDYANRMVLVPPQISEEDLESGKMPTEILVDSKEFDLVNSKLTLQVDRLEEFEKRLQRFTKDKIDIFGGGDLGEYE